MTTDMETLNKAETYMFVVYSPKSRVGKDTVANIICERLLYCDVVKFASTFKRTFEEWLGLMLGELDEPAVKNSFVVNPVTNEKEDFTYIDLMVRAYKYWDDIYPGGWLTVGKTYEQLLENFIDNIIPKHVILTDVRKQCEVEIIRRVSNLYRTVLITIEPGERGVKLESDGNIEIDDGLIPYYKRWVIHNDSLMSLEQLEVSVNTIIDSLGL